MTDSTPATAARCVQSDECCWGGPLMRACYVHDACGCQVVRHAPHSGPLPDPQPDPSERVGSPAWFARRGVLVPPPGWDADLWAQYAIGCLELEAGNV